MGHHEDMNLNYKGASKYSLSTIVGASTLLLGLTLTGCSTNAPEPAAETSNGSSTPKVAPDTAGDADAPATATAATTAAAEPSEKADSKPTEKAGSQGRQVTMHVEGAQSEALVKALVVTGGGKETGGEMTSQTLPFDQQVTLPAGSVFNKILVLGKYASGATGEISCSISIDGVNVSSQSSSGHKPAECLFVEKNAK